jgi:hypothetical protein
VPLLDRDGRLFGRVNILDAAVLLGAVLAGVAAYHLLTAGNRIAPPFALPENSAWVSATLWMPPGEAFLQNSFTPGDLQRDPRTGEPIAELISSHVNLRGFWVELRLYAQRDAEGRWLYRDRHLLPGRELEIETSNVVLLGKVAALSPPPAVP